MERKYIVSISPANDQYTLYIRSWTTDEEGNEQSVLTHSSTESNIDAVSVKQQEVIASWQQ